jgi:cytochrome bd ubiquinol oxidase subunit II
VTGVEASPLALFWAGVIAVAILVYVILDGFDLGVGVLFGTTREEEKRVQMMNTIAPFWDGNETWLVVIGAGLFAAFPVVYAVFLGAFYMPVLLLLFGLIFRGIAFEFRHRTERMRWLWDRGFFIGSTVAAFVQGAAIGAMMKGIPVANNQYAGGAFDWVAPFPVLTGIGLVLGYALLGAGWLVLKSEGSLRDWAFARIPWLAVAVLAVLAIAVSQTLDYSAVAKSHWGDRRWGVVFPAIGGLALLGILLGARRKHDVLPFAMTALFFLCAYPTLGVMFWPYRREGGGAGGVARLPLIRRRDRASRLAAYTVHVYWVFRGKVHAGYG